MDNIDRIISILDTLTENQRELTKVVKSNQTEINRLRAKLKDLEHENDKK